MGPHFTSTLNNALCHFFKVFVNLKVKQSEVVLHSSLEILEKKTKNILENG